MVHEKKQAQMKIAIKYFMLFDVKISKKCGELYKKLQDSVAQSKVEGNVEFLTSGAGYKNGESAGRKLSDGRQKEAIRMGNI